MRRLRTTATTTVACNATTTSVAVDPEDDARVIVHYANCSTEKVELWLSSDDAVVLDLKNRGINTILSLPRNTELLDLSWNNALSSPFNLSMFPSLTNVYLRGCNLTNLSSFTWPPLLTELNLRDNQLQTIAATELPSTLRKLKLSNNPLTTLDTIATLPNLRVLIAAQNQITSIQTLPLLLQQLDVSGNHLTSLTNLDLPSNLMRLNLSSNLLQSIDNVRFPSSLRELDICGNAIELFHVDQRDVVSLRESTTISSSPYDWGANASVCDSSATLTWVQRAPLCVVPASVMTLGTISPTLGPAYTTVPNNHKESLDLTTDGTGRFNVTLASSVGALVVLVALVSLSIMALFKRRHPAPSSAKQPQDPEAGLSKSPIDTSSNTTSTPSPPIADLSEASQSSQSTCHTPSSSSYSSSSSSSLELSLSSSTIEQDTVLLHHLGLTPSPSLIPRSNWTKHHVISNSSSQGTEVILANYTKAKTKGTATKSIHKQLVIKQLTSTTPAAVLAFREEVRTCSQLHHASLVPFLGVTTTVLSELAYVCEYLPTGDLATALSRQRSKSDYRKTFTWLASDLGSNPPTSSELGTSKLELVLELLDGLRYLQSQDPFLVHQRLDSSAILVWASSQSRHSRHRSNSSQRRSLARANRSVLQFSLFGIIHAPTQHERMASTSMGTPWVAPEVLKGAPCDARANIYSLGVIMTELDTCERPYHSGIEGFLPPHPSNTKVAIMVSAGSVQPQLHEDCPSTIRTLIKQCLSYEPEDRPTLSQVLQQLMTLR